MLFRIAFGWLAGIDPGMLLWQIGCLTSRFFMG